jgi:predicted RNA-binding protein with PUA-like domain
MNYWLMKTEPETFSWDDMVRDKKAVWDGVRNYTARNNMRDMKKGDMVYIYHSGGSREVVGIAEITKEHYPDPTIDDPAWVAVNLKPKNKLKNPVTLATIKADERMQEVGLVRQSRLSVMPLSEDAFNIILQLSQNA